MLGFVELVKIILNLQILNLDLCKNGYIEIVLGYLSLVLISILITVIYFIVNIVQIILNLTLLGVKTFVKFLLKLFLLKINVCIVKVVLNGFIANFSVYQTIFLLNYVKMIYLLFVKIVI